MSKRRRIVEITKPGGVKRYRCEKKFLWWWHPMYELGYDGDGEEVYYHMEYASLEEAIKSLDTEVTEKVVWESIK